MVSVIVPVYKVEKYLRRCLDSIINQTNSDLEIILVDDGSPDTCGCICDEYAAKDPRVVVIHKENAGLGYARNSGLDICTGEYVMFVDSDDYLSENAVQILLDRMLQDGSDMAVGKHIDVYEDGSTNDGFWSFKTNCVMTPKDVFSTEKNTFPVCAWAKLYKRELFDSIRYTSIAVAEDLWVFPFIIEHCQKISVEISTIYFYCRRLSSLMYQKDLKSRLAFVEARLHMSIFLYKNGYKDKACYYFSAAVNIAVVIQKRSDRFYLFTKYFDKKTRKLLLKGAGMKAKIKWYLMYIPCSNNLLNLLRR